MCHRSLARGLLDENILLAVQILTPLRFDPWDHFANRAAQPAAISQQLFSAPTLYKPSFQNNKALFSSCFQTTKVSLFNTIQRLQNQTYHFQTFFNMESITSHVFSNLKSIIVRLFRARNHYFFQTRKYKCSTVFILQHITIRFQARISMSIFQTRKTHYSCFQTRKYHCSFFQTRNYHYHHHLFSKLENTSVKVFFNLERITFRCLQNRKCHLSLFKLENITGHCQFNEQA